MNKKDWSDYFWLSFDRALLTCLLPGCNAPPYATELYCLTPTPVVSSHQLEMYAQMRLGK
jgi:hypothetical protein